MAHRRALGDTGADQALIRTLHKRGFRFVGDVQTVGASETRAAATRVVPDRNVASGDVPAGGPVSLEVSRLDDVVSESVKAEAITRLSIAVLPFGNMSDDPENDYFSYGLTEDIIRLLARNRWLSVISRHSTIAFQGRTVDAREVGEQLGVRYVMVGSVRKSRDTVRITAELVRARMASNCGPTNTTCNSNISSISGEIAGRMRGQRLSLSFRRSSSSSPPGRRRKTWTPGIATSAVYGIYGGLPRRGSNRRKPVFQRAIDADPNFARGHGALSYVDLQRAFIDEPKDRAARLETALRQGRHAVALDELDCFCHCALGQVLCATHQNDEALAALDVSLELIRALRRPISRRGSICSGTGGRLEAETLLDRATMLSPRDSHLWSFHAVRSWAHFSLGEYDIAVEFARRAARQPNVTYQAFATLAASLGLLGERAQAEAVATELRQRKPNYSTGTARQEFFFCNDAGFIDQFVEGLRVAGISDV